MTVALTYSTDPGGDAIGTPYDFGEIANGVQSSALELYISHDGTNPITDCGFFIAAYGGAGYDGNAGVTADYNELIDWGDDDEGFQIAQNATTPSYSSCKTNSGDSASNAIALTAASGVTEAPDMNAGSEAHIKVRVSVPASETTTGIRYAQLHMKFSYTS
jgi:hypothetical protein